MIPSIVVCRSQMYYYTTKKHGHDRILIVNIIHSSNWQRSAMHYLIVKQQNNTSNVNLLVRHSHCGILYMRCPCVICRAICLKRSNALSWAVLWVYWYLDRPLRFYVFLASVSDEFVIYTAEAGTINYVFYTYCLTEIDDNFEIEKLSSNSV